ncbi:hypothetical protein OQA88_7397 [Cercophora sp. LCS_1]
METENEKKTAYSFTLKMSSSKQNREALRLNVVSSRAFLLFRRLPLELRVMIWKDALKVRRNLYLLCSQDTSSADPADQPGNTASGQAYMAITSPDRRPKCRHPNSPLLQVNRESRREAFQFYRVRLPCRFLQPPSPMLARCIRSTTRRYMGQPASFLYANPEHDHIFVVLSKFCEADDERNDLIDDLEAADPTGVGMSKTTIHFPSGKFDVPRDEDLGAKTKNMLFPVKRIRSVYRVEISGECL